MRKVLKFGLAFSFLFLLTTNLCFAYTFSVASELKNPTASNNGFSNGDYIYSVSGANNAILADSVSVRINSSFTLGEFTEQPELGKYLWSAYASSNKFAYVLGGVDSFLQPTSDVHFAEFTSSGNLTNWKSSTPIPNPSSLGASVIVNSYIYYVGGYLENLQNPNDKAFFSKISDTGSVLGWNETSPLPIAAGEFNLINYGDYLYAIGFSTTSSVFSAKINTDGSLQPWSLVASEFHKSSRASVSIINKRIFVLGGYIESSSSPSRSLYWADIEDGGSLSQWSEQVNAFSNPHCCSPMVTTHGRLYVLGSHDGSGYYSNIWQSDQIGDPGQFQATISPTPTASPTPTPSAQVNKVILIPGLGASWNAEAILRCKTSGYAGGWSLSPLAQTVYQKFIESFSGTGKTLLPFYYDWRQDIRQTALKLKEFVAANTAPGEKVDIVGHSLGGLIGRAYLENGGATKVRNFVAVGSPNRGIVRTYGAWEGGEVWNDNLIYQMAQTLALRGCTVLRTNPTAIIHKVFPSLQNILPTFDYLRDARTNMITKVDSMHEKNNYLPTGFESMFQGLFVSTVAGTNNKTAAMLEVSKPNRLESILGLWTDGKPTKQIKVHEGDDTVLVTSAQLAGANNKLIRQGHWGIIASTEGVKTIFDLLGISRTVSATLFTEPTSAVVVTSTENSISDPNGSNTTMKVYYGDTLATNFEVTPKNGKINISIGQFLRDGTVTWKDYSFARNTKLKGRLNFDAKKFKEDVLQY